MDELLKRLAAWLLVLLGLVWGLTVLIAMIRPLIGWTALGGLIVLGGWFCYRRCSNTYW